jgi:hypothetical protein
MRTHTYRHRLPHARHVHGRSQRTGIHSNGRRGYSQYIHIYIHAYTHTYVYIYIYICIVVCVYIYIYIYIYTRAHKCTRTHIHTGIGCHTLGMFMGDRSTQVLIYTQYIHIYLHAYIHMYMYVYIYMHIYVYI